MINKTYKIEDCLEIIHLAEYAKDISSKDIADSFKKHFSIIDYVALQKLRQEIGMCGEQYVLATEKERLRKVNSKYENYVDGSPALDGRNGYDILSYTAVGEPIYIEVKTTTGDCEEPFYMSKNERNTADRIRAMGGIYQIHRVYNMGKIVSVQIIENDDCLDYDFVNYEVRIVEVKKNR